MVEMSPRIPLSGRAVCSRMNSGVFLPSILLGDAGKISFCGSSDRNIAQHRLDEGNLSCLDTMASEVRALWLGLARPLSFFSFSPLPSELGLEQPDDSPGTQNGSG